VTAASNASNASMMAYLLELMFETLAVGTDK
jgi:hypothetical protein